MVAAVVKPAWTSGGVPNRLRTYVLAYLFMVVGILAIAVAINHVPAIRHIAQTIVPFNWHVAPHDPNARDLITAFSIWFHNARLTLAPLALAAAVQNHPGRLRTAGDVLLGVIFAANVIPFAVDLGTWGSQLLPYIPNAPVELIGVSSGPVSWWLVTRGRMSVRSLALVAGVVIALLLIAASLETWAVA